MFYCFAEAMETAVKIMPLLSPAECEAGDEGRDEPIAFEKLRPSIAKQHSGQCENA